MIPNPSPHPVPPSRPTALAISQQLWVQLEQSPWASPADLAEALTWLIYTRWLDSESRMHQRADCEKRWSFWRGLSLRARYMHLKDVVYPSLQTRSPMSGQLIGLILPTIPFAIPDAKALSGLLDLIDATAADTLLEAILPLLNIQEPPHSVLAHALALLNPFSLSGSRAVIWEPACRSGRFLALCAEQLQQSHWREIWANPQRLSQFRGQFFGRVSSRPEALLSAMRLLLAGQPAPSLDGYSLPWPRPDLIWTVHQPGLDRSSLLRLLAPAGRLAIWHPGQAHTGRQALSQGSLEILSAERQRQLQEAAPAYQVRSTVKLPDKAPYIR
ncbi:MAG: hypothetical protein CVV27_11320 [Candidatus Melainabacteria bacterium HGW-Melainabacteria-1]|nr:MAG: hypothetical protein CVV27_11320 [Candidatus Melainabacteria bacterium HGW-Melainabacteria-1]